MRKVSSGYYGEGHLSHEQKAIVMVSNQKDPKEISNRVLEFISKGEFDAAERLLVKAREEAAARGNEPLLQEVLSELIELYGISSPPRWTEAVALAEERERHNDSAYTKLQTAMILFHGAGQHAAAIPKLEEAIAQARIANDDKTLYASLSLLGQASLEIGRTESALRVLGEIEQMTGMKRLFVVGDETSFLESLRVRGLEPQRVRRLASILMTVCRDRAFRQRLSAIAAG